MWIDIDLADDRMISSVGVRDPVRLLEFKRDTSAEINVRFWLAGIRQELAVDAAGEIGIKPAGEYDGELLVYAGEWVKTGTETDTFYTFTPAFDGAAITAQLGSGDGNTENDEVSVTGMLEIKWIAEGKKHRTQTVQAIVSNDVLKDGDVTPTPIVTLWAAPLALTTPPEDGGETLVVHYDIGGGPLSMTLTRSADVDGKPAWSDGGSYCKWIAADGKWKILRFDIDQGFLSETDSDWPEGPWVDEDDGPETVTSLDFGGTDATAKGQLAIVTTTNDSGTFEDVWTCSKVSPVTWQPPGNIYRDRTSGTLYRKFIDATEPAYEEAYPS
jgi:hypothetical protein